MIVHYNCTIGSFLLHFFLLIYHPYPPSFHEMIFILVISFIQYIIVYIELIKLQMKNLIKNLTQGPTPQHRVCSHCEICNVFYRLHLVVGTFSIEFGSINDDV